MACRTITLPLPLAENGCLNDVEIEQEDLCGVSVPSSKLYTYAPSNFLYAVQFLFSFEMFCIITYLTLLRDKSTFNFHYSFFKGGEEWQFNKFVPDVLESGLTVAVSYTKIY